MPAVVLRSSPARCWVVPNPAEPKLTSLDLLFAKAISSGRLFTGESERTAMTKE